MKLIASLLAAAIFASVGLAADTAPKPKVVEKTFNSIEEARKFLGEASKSRPSRVVLDVGETENPDEWEKETADSKGASLKIRGDKFMNDFNSEASNAALSRGTGSKGGGSKSKSSATALNLMGFAINQILSFLLGAALAVGGGGYFLKKNNRRAAIFCALAGGVLIAGSFFPELFVYFLLAGAATLAIPLILSEKEAIERKESQRAREEAISTLPSEQRAVIDARTIAASTSPSDLSMIQKIQAADALKPLGSAAQT